MNTKLLVVAALSGTAVACAGADAPRTRTPSGEVTLPLPEFRDLFEAARLPVPKVPPGPPAVFDSAEYSLDLSAGDGLVRAVWKVRSFLADPVLVPVVPLDARILPGVEGTLAPQGDFLALYCPSPGVHEARAALAARESSAGTGRCEILFPVVPALTSVIEVSGVRPGESVSVRGARPLGGSRFLLPPRSAEVVVAVDSGERKPASRWEWRSDVLVEPGEAILRCRARLAATLLDGDGAALRVPLPEGPRGVRARAEGLAEQSVTRTPEGRRELALRWDNECRGERIVDLEYDLPSPPGAAEWNLSAPPPSGPGAANLFAVTLPAWGVFSDPSNPDAPVPGWVREALAGREAGFYAGGASLPVRVTRLPVAEPASLIVRQAKFRTTVVRDGSSLTEGEAEIETSGPARWEVSLPAGARLLDCEVGGAPARPSRRGDALEFSLERGGGTVLVKFSYTFQGPPLDPVGGGLPVSLPGTGVFVRAVEWRLQIPDSYEVAGIDTNAEILTPAKPGEIVLGRQLLRGTAVAAEISYRKRGIQ